MQGPSFHPTDSVLGLHSQRKENIAILRFAQTTATYSQEEKHWKMIRTLTNHRTASETIEISWQSLNRHNARLLHFFVPEHRKISGD